MPMMVTSWDTSCPSSCTCRVRASRMSDGRRNRRLGDRRERRRASAACGTRGLGRAARAGSFQSPCGVVAGVALDEPQERADRRGRGSPPPIALDLAARTRRSELDRGREARGRTRCPRSSRPSLGRAERQVRPAGAADQRCPALPCRVSATGSRRGSAARRCRRSGGPGPGCRFDRVGAPAGHQDAVAERREVQVERRGAGVVVVVDPVPGDRARAAAPPLRVERVRHDPPPVVAPFGVDDQVAAGVRPE